MVPPDGHPGWDTAWTGAGGGLRAALSLWQDRDGDTLGSGLAEDVFTVCLLWRVFVIVREARQRGQAGLIVPRL